MGTASDKGKDSLELNFRAVGSEPGLQRGETNTESSPVGMRMLQRDAVSITLALRLLKPKSPRSLKWEKRKPKTYTSPTGVEYFYPGTRFIICWTTF